MLIGMALYKTGGGTDGLAKRLVLPAGIMGRTCRGFPGDYRRNCSKRKRGWSVEVFHVYGQYLQLLGKSGGEFRNISARSCFLHNRMQHMA